MGSAMTKYVTIKKGNRETIVTYRNYASTITNNPHTLAER
jgi:hypothetical protein